MLTILASIISLSIVVNFLLMQLTISNYRWNIFWIRQVVKLAMYRSSFELALRVLNLFSYFAVTRHVLVELAICAINLMLVVLCHQFWQQMYRKNITLYWLSTRRMSDSDFTSMQTVVVKPSN